MTINTRQELIDMLYAEMKDAEYSIADLEDIISSAEEDIIFIKGRRCLACSLLNRLEVEDE